MSYTAILAFLRESKSRGRVEALWTSPVTPSSEKFGWMVPSTENRLEWWKCDPVFPSP